MKKTGIVDWFGGYDRKTNRPNNFGFLINGTYFNGDSVLCNKEDMVKGVIVSYEILDVDKSDNTKNEAREVQLLSNEMDIEFLFSGLTDENKKISESVDKKLRDIIQGESQASYNGTRIADESLSNKRNNQCTEDLSIYGSWNRLNNYVEEVFEGKISNKEICDYMHHEWEEEQQRLQELNEEDFFKYKPKGYFISQILYIKKALFLYKLNPEKKIISHCKDTVNLIPINHALVKCYEDLLTIFLSSNLYYSDVKNVIGENFWSFLNGKQKLRLENPGSIYQYFRLMLPKCCSHNRFREARMRKSREELLSGKYDISGTEEEKERITGYFYCQHDKCFYAETFSSIDPKKPYHEYTLLDMFSILKLNKELKARMVFTDSDNTKYIAILCAWTNLILDDKKYVHLLCSKCKKLMLPCIGKNEENYDFNWFSASAYISCENHEDGHDKLIYISHCRNPKCTSVIDSRTSKYQCDNSRYICEVCGFCNCVNLINKHLKFKYIREREYELVDIRDKSTDILNVDYIEGFNPEARIKNDIQKQDIVARNVQTSNNNIAMILINTYE